MFKVEVCLFVIFHCLDGKDTDNRFIVAAGEKCIANVNTIFLFHLIFVMTDKRECDLGTPIFHDVVFISYCVVEMFLRFLDEGACRIFLRLREWALPEHSSVLGLRNVAILSQYMIKAFKRQR